jgi:hypothetical protein
MKNYPRKNGWGGRIRTHGWRDQNPLPYRLATPQLKDRYKNTIFPYILGVTLFFFLFLIFCALPSRSQEELIRNPLKTPIFSLKFLNQAKQVLYTSSGKLFSNLDSVNFLHSTNEDDFLIYEINSLDSDFYLSTNLGLFKNFERIFSRETIYHFSASKKDFFCSGPSGIYRAPRENTSLFSDWYLIPESPPQSKFFTLNKSQSNPEFASSDYGFYYYNSRAKKWINRSHGLNQDFEDSYGLGRFLVLEEKNTSPLVLLPSSNGIYISYDKGETWSLINQGLKSNPDGFFILREIREFDDQIVLIGSTGFYYASKSKFSDPENLAFSFTWQKLDIENSEKNTDYNEDFYSIDIIKASSPKEDSKILIGNSQGQVFKISKEDLRNLDPLKELVLIENPPETNVHELSIKKSRVNEILELEPSLEELHKVALKFAGIPTGQKFDSYKMQARLRNLMPDFEAFVEKDIQDFLSIETSGEDSFTSSSSSLSTSFDEVNILRDDDQTNTGIRFKWNLTNLIYDPEITDINNSARITANIRENILTEINQIYFARKELLCKLLSEQKLLDQKKEKLKLEEYTAQLDARTGYWFSKQIKKEYFNES